MMVTKIARFAALPAVAAMLMTAVACTADEPTPSPEPTTTVTTTSGSTATPTTTSGSTTTPTTTPGSTTAQEQGYAMNCSGVRDDGTTVMVELYTNSTVDVPASVVVTEAGEAGEPILITADDAPSPTIADGEVSADVPLISAATRSDAGTAEVRGTYESTGEVREVDEDIEDAGERIRSTGTNEDLTTDLGVQIGDEEIDLQCSEAFAFDLEVTKTPIN